MKTVHVIWHHEKHSTISDHKVIAGIVLTGWRDADAIVDRLNANDPDRRSWSRHGNYWKEEINVLTLDNLGD